MNATAILFIIAALIVGFILGMVAELLAEAEQVNYLNQRIDFLKRENDDLEQKLANERALNKVHTIEITDKTVDLDNIPDFTGSF